MFFERRKILSDHDKEQNALGDRRLYPIRKLWILVLSEAIITWVILHPKYVSDANRLQKKSWRETNRWIKGNSKTLNMCLELSRIDKDSIINTTKRLLSMISAGTVPDRIAHMRSIGISCWQAMYNIENVESNYSIRKSDKRNSEPDSCAHRCRICSKKRGDAKMIGTLCERCYKRIWERCGTRSEDSAARKRRWREKQLAERGKEWLNSERERRKRRTARELADRIAARSGAKVLAPGHGFNSERKTERG